MIKFEFRFLVEDGDYISNDVIGYVDIRAKGKKVKIIGLVVDSKRFGLSYFTLLIWIHLKHSPDYMRNREIYQ